MDTKEYKYILLKYSDDDLRDVLRDCRRGLVVDSDTRAKYILAEMNRRGILQKCHG